MVLRLPGLVLCGVLLCSSVSAVAQEASTPAELLTLDQAIALAQENNRLIKISHQSVLQANDQLLAVRTQRYPRFNIQLTGSYLLTAVHVNFPQGSFGFVNGTPVPNTNSILTTEPEWSALAYVDVYQPLSELYNIHLNVEAAQVAKKLTEEQLRQQRQQIINSVKDAYYGMLQTQSALDAATDNVKFLHELDRTTEQYVAEKTALPYQSTGVKAQLAQADLQVVTLLDTLATQKENLNSLMGRDLWIDFRLEPVPQELPEEKNLEAARQAALQNRTVQQIPVVARLQMEERATLSDVQNLYVSSSESDTKVPLLSVSSVENVLQRMRISHLEHSRTISVQSFTVPGALPSEVFAAASPRIQELRKNLPPGYNIVVSGEQAKQDQGFKNLALVMMISIALIFLALALQFRHSIKPLLVLAATPYGIVGALIALYLMGAPFGFMAFLGIASLIGVIVSHVIVLFDFIEEMHEKGEALDEALLDAGIVRLRPVMITVGATILALFPLALHGGPLWQPLCYAQIGGLGVATFITLLLVPVLYSIFVLDLKLVTWTGPASGSESASTDSKGERP